MADATPREVVTMTATNTALLARLDERAMAAERQAAAIRKMAEGASELGDEGLALLAALLADGHNGNGNAHSPPAPVEPDESTPRGREAVRRIVAEKPGIWSLADLKATMRDLGWFTSAKAVDVAVTRLCASGEARRVGHGRYEFGFADRKEGAIERHASRVAMITR